MEEAAELGQACEEVLRTGEGWEEIFDGWGDTLYLLLGIAVTLDLPVEEIFREVHASNMTKDFSGDPRVRDKGPNYCPPNFKAMVEQWLGEQAS